MFKTVTAVGYRSYDQQGIRIFVNKYLTVPYKKYTSQKTSYGLASNRSRRCSPAVKFPTNCSLLNGSQGLRQLPPNAGYHRHMAIQHRNFASSATLEQILEENREVIAKLTGIPGPDLKYIPRKKINEKYAAGILDVMHKFEFPTSSIRLHPRLLVMTPGAVENYIRIMEESGFPEINERFILRFRTIYNQSIPTLQKKLGVPKLIDIINRHCSVLGENSSVFTPIVNALPKDTKHMSLFELRSLIMTTYFTSLSTTEVRERAKSAVVRYPRLPYRSLNWIRRSYDILKGLEFSDEKICKHIYLLYADPSNLLDIKKIESLGGMMLKNLADSRPKILMSSRESLLEIHQSLVDHRIPFEAIQKYPDLFTLSPITVRQRLQDMDNIPEFQILKTHPRVARLLYYQKKAKLRLDKFRTKRIRLPSPSLHMLSVDSKKFNKSLSTGDLRVKGVDVMIHLSDIFQVNKIRVRESLTRHPHWLQISLVNMTSVLTYIKSVHTFSKDQLIDAIPILLYSKDKVEQEFENVLKSGEASHEDSYFLQMVLYFLERPSHFTGDAVWGDNIVKHGDMEEEDDENINGSRHFD